MKPLSTMIRLRLQLKSALVTSLAVLPALDPLFQCFYLGFRLSARRTIRNGNCTDTYGYCDDNEQEENKPHFWTHI